jgi:hypothetical protein
MGSNHTKTPKRKFKIIYHDEKNYKGINFAPKQVLSKMICESRDFAHFFSFLAKNEPDNE